MSLSRHLLVVPLAIPLSAALSPSRLEEQASALGKRLGDATASIHAAFVSRPSPVVPAPVAGDVVTVVPDDSASHPVQAAPKRGTRPAKREVKTPDIAGGIFIGKDTVMRLARAGVVPRGQPVAASAGHPAGILLAGVGALGIGLVDGDILIEVEGRPVQTEAQVVGMVLAARSRHAEQMSAVIWRSGAPAHAHPHARPDAHNGERWSLVVAMPYL
ncbi:MAG TPA: hypothetical protein VHC69_17615 [Polyangiaceae bacterium]|nr:hypothetical protein [Polyangiaceae bacterium]